MKWLAIVAAMIGIVAGGYYWYSQKGVSHPDPLVTVRGRTVTIDSSQWSAPDGTPHCVSLSISWGDKTSSTNDPKDGNEWKTKCAGKSQTHSYLAAGFYKIKLYVISPGPVQGSPGFDALGREHREFEVTVE